jgi:hypothetical protein
MAVVTGAVDCTDADEGEAHGRWSQGPLGRPGEPQGRSQGCNPSVIYRPHAEGQRRKAREGGDEERTPSVYPIGVNRGAGGEGGG